MVHPCGRHGAERHALIELHAVTDDGRLADDHAGAVVDGEILADGRAGIDVDARLRVGILRHDARDHRHFLKIQLVRDAVDEDGKHPGVGQNDLLPARGRGVAVVVGGQVLEQQLLDMGQTLHHRLADLLGAARALLPLRHHQLKLAQQLVVDVPHEQGTVLLRRELQQVAIAVVGGKQDLLKVADDLNDRRAARQAQRVAVHQNIAFAVVLRHLRGGGTDDLIFIGHRSFPLIHWRG